MLDLIEYRMHKGHVGCRKLSGHLSVDKREEASAFFSHHENCFSSRAYARTGGIVGGYCSCCLKCKLV